MALSVPDEGHYFFLETSDALEIRCIRICEDYMGIVLKLFALHAYRLKKIDFIYLIICTCVRSRIRENHEYFMKSKYCTNV